MGRVAQYGATGAREMTEEHSLGWGLAQLAAPRWHNLLPKTSEPKEGQLVVLAIPGINQWAYEVRQWWPSYWTYTGALATRWLPIEEPPPPYGWASDSDT